MRRYGDAEFTKTLEVVPNLTIPLSLIQIIGAKIAIGNTSGEDMIDGDEKDTGDGDHGVTNVFISDPVSESVLGFG